MKRSLLFCAMFCSTAVLAQDDVGGSPKADFTNNQLRVPCVLVEGLNDQTEGMYYDIVLSRRGNSFNYELSTAQPEDTDLCELIAEYAEYKDDDFDEDDGEPEDPDIFAQCTVWPERSRIHIEAKDLDEGNYLARVSSGENIIDSVSQPAVEGVVDFRFDSDSVAVANGAEAIQSAFITDAQVTAEIRVGGTEELVVGTTVSCEVVEADEASS